MVIVTRTDFRCKIEGLDSYVQHNLSKELSYETSVWSRLRSENMPQYISLLTKTGTFQDGLWNNVLKFLDKNEVEYKTIDNRMPIPNPTKEQIVSAIKLMPFKPRGYQLETIVAGCITYRRALIALPTGSGKTYILAALAAIWDRPSLILVNKKDLMYQIQKELAEYRGQHIDEIGLIGDGKYKPQYVTVALVQSLSTAKGKKGKKISGFLKTVEALFVDECHHALSKTYKAVMSTCSNAAIRYGFSATPYSEREDNFGKEIHKDIVLRSYFGPFIGKVKTKQLIEEGWLSKLAVKVVQNTVYHDGVILPYVDEYDRIIIKDDSRNMNIAKIIAHHYYRGENIVGFVMRLEHGETIAQLLVKFHKIPAHHVAFVNGELMTDTRHGMISSFKDGDIKILLGTVLSEGLNFLADVGMNISGGKSENQVVQRAGRVLRKPRCPILNDVDTTEQREVLFYDFQDKGHPIFNKHSQRRVKVYRKEGHPLTSVDISEFT
jgi:superfamily II DNA or RNA helicase